MKTKYIEVEWKETIHEDYHARMTLPESYFKSFIKDPISIEEIAAALKSEMTAVIYDAEGEYSENYIDDVKVSIVEVPKPFIASNYHQESQIQDICNALRKAGVRIAGVGSCGQFGNAYTLFEELEQEETDSIDKYASVMIETVISHYQKKRMTENQTTALQMTLDNFWMSNDLLSEFLLYVMKEEL